MIKEHNFSFPAHAQWAMGVIERRGVTIKIEVLWLHHDGVLLFKIRVDKRQNKCTYKFDTGAGDGSGRQ